MLVLSRRKFERIRIGNDIVITIVDIVGRQVKVGIEAPEHLDVHRQEVYDRIAPPKDADGYQLIPRDEFDNLCRQKKFSNGPFMDDFGDGYGDPYMPPSARSVRGTLKDGRKVKANAKEVKR